MDNKTVDIIIPAYNVEKYIRRCMDSIISQNEPMFKIIVVNDMSTDGTGTICDEYASIRANDVKVFHNVKNAGVSYSRNMGILNSNADYIMFIDADDYLVPGSLKVIKDVITHTDADIYEYGFNVYRDGKIERTQTVIEDANPMPSEKYLEKALSAYTYEWYVWKYIFKKEIFKEEGNLFPLNMHYEDVYLLPKLLKSTNTIMPIQNIVYNYMLGTPGAITNGIRLCTEKDKISACKHAIEVSDLFRSESLRYLMKDNFSMLFYSALIVLFALKSEKEQDELYKTLKEAKYVTQYANKKVYRLINASIRILGLKTTSKLLYVRMVAKNGKSTI